ncbi:sulfatase-like hydrolase/transferase [Alienimonas chondri]|uniref:Choline-sulfatase n=1 Tax=Alienimonas chondri TaxID=2681879 RepID=A0ABX1V7A5_9PLAN|nr:sulfatase-like hydrolase/transferase [Alienimonas chondri]NNJ24117.1 Choline-sulfatase [Alienimonas chondri]
MISIATLIALAMPAFGPPEGAGAGPEVGQRPNIVVIVTDDQAPWAMGNAVAQGWFRDVPAAHTPHMDRLAREGAVFQNFFCTTPVCSPARVSLMTGRYASEFDVYDFITAPDHKLFDPDAQVALDPDASVTFAEALQQSGYHTGLVGKWHLGDWTLPGNEAQHPTRHGFDYFIGLTSGGTTPDDPPLEKDGQVRQFKGLTTDLLTDEAIAFLQRSAEGDSPFLLCFHTRAPHGRWLPVAPEDWAPYADADVPLPEFDDLNLELMDRYMREYLASTSGVDRNLGRLLDTLNDLAVADDTVVIFTSDHGYNMGHNGIWHKGNGIWATRTKPPGKTHQGTRVVSDKYRPNMYDLSLKVPAIIRWPGTVAPGTVIKQTASSLDLFPTLLSMAQVERPDDLVLRGRDLTPLLWGESPTNWENDFYAEYSMHHYAVASMRCYRTPRYKLIRDFHNAGRDEFYDLQVDPQESRNRIDDPAPEIRAAIEELHRKLLASMEMLNDPLFKTVRTDRVP